MVRTELCLILVKKSSARILPTPLAVFCPGAGCIQSSFVRNIILKGALGSFKMKDVFSECKTFITLVLNFILFPTGFMTTRGQKVARDVRLFQTSKESIYSLVLHMNQLCEYFFLFIGNCYHGSSTRERSSIHFRDQKGIRGPLSL